MPILEISLSCGSINPTRDITISAITPNIIMFMIATTLILGGYFPGYFPPIEASPQGIPACKSPPNLPRNRTR